MLGDRGVSWGSVRSLVNSFFIAQLAVDIRLIALIAMPVVGCISNGFERKRNADSIVHQ